MSLIGRGKVNSSIKADDHKRSSQKKKGKYYYSVRR